MRTVEEIKNEIEQNWVFQHFSLKQRDFFIDLLSKLKPSYCLETGFCTGSSSATILSTCHPTKLISVGLAYNNLEIAKNLEEQYSFKFIQGDSTQVLSPAFFESEYLQGIDFYYVDGGHEYAVALADLDNALPSMNEGSVIIVDDYHSQACPLPTVEQAVDEFVKSHNLNMEKIIIEDGKGMALIQL
mgnify:CR=1 FL=1